MQNLKRTNLRLKWTWGEEVKMRGSEHDIRERFTHWHETYALFRAVILP